MVAEFEEQLTRFRAAAKDAESWAEGAQTMYGEIAKQLANCVELFESTAQMLEQERQARLTAERQRERFRYALWVYLQDATGSPESMHQPARP